MHNAEVKVLKGKELSAKRITANKHNNNEIKWVI